MDRERAADQGQTDRMQIDRMQIDTPAGRHPPIEPPRTDLAYKLSVFAKKNNNLLFSRHFWRAAALFLVVYARSLLKPARDRDEVLFVSTHHKAMTTYFRPVLRILSAALRLPYADVNFNPPPPGTRVFLSNQSFIDFDRLGAYRGVHVMRDPRDMIVSGYHYHKWTHEVWVHRLDENGESYQQKLNRLDKKAGLFLEIDHFIYIYRGILEKWDVDDPRILEVSYEALMGEGRTRLYGAIFAHLGLAGAELALAVELMRLFEAGNRKRRPAGRIPGRAPGRRQHLRSGSSNQWKDELDPEHLAYIEAELGHVLAKFGYAGAPGAPAAAPGRGNGGENPRADRRAAGGLRAGPVAD